MEFPCECDINVRNDNALRFAIVTKPTPIIEYVKTIASVIGATHILGVFEDGDFIKVYFDDKKYVDALIRSGIHVMGHHIKVDYVVPPGRKIILSNIDPVISNNDLIRLMSMFGSVVSPVFRSPISDDVELCHIDCGVRYFYMNLNIPVPNALEFKYGDQICKIDIKLDDSTCIVPYVKKEPIELNTTESSSNGIPDDSIDLINIDNINLINDDNIDIINDDDNDLNITDPVVVHAQSTTEVDSEQQNEAVVETNSILMTSKRTICKARLTKLKTSQINKKVKHNKYKNRRTRRFKISRNTALNSIQPSSPTLSPEDTSTPQPALDDNFISKDSKNILSEVKLKLFLKEVRFQRAPAEFLKKYLGPDFDSNALLCLIEQLRNYKKRSADIAVKHRIHRLINNLESFKENE